MKYEVIRDLTEEERNYSDVCVRKGDFIYEFNGCTYGCIGDGIACSRVEGENPFFEMPVDSIKEIS